MSSKCEEIYVGGKEKGNLRENKCSFIIKITIINIGVIILLLFFYTSNRMKNERKRNIDLKYKLIQEKTLLHDMKENNNDLNYLLYAVLREKNIISNNIQRIRKSNENLKKEYDMKKNAVIKVKEKIKRIQKDIKEIRQENNIKEEEVMNLKKQLNALKKEIDEYRDKIDIIKEKNDKVPKLNSVLGINKDKVKLIVNWVNEKIKNPFNFNLLYRYPGDSLSSNQFHKKCDRRSNTLILIKIADEVIIGGFTTKSWDGFGFKYDESAFIFNLQSEKMYPINNSAQAIYSDISSKYIIVFGVGDIFIDELEARSNFPQSYGSKAAILELTGGRKIFDVFALEVFELVLI